MLSFIVTHRNRELQLIDYVENIHRFYPNAEIVISEQRNTNVFLQGQLFNLAFPHSHGDIIILMDVDIRFSNTIDFEKWMGVLKHPFIGYDRIFNCDENKKILNIRPGTDRTHGGCCVFTRDQFIDSCGYSNLMCDWGAEDDILDIRVNGFKRIHNSLLHIYHEKRKSSITYPRNRIMYETEKKRDKKLDGWKQTTAKLKDKQQGYNSIYLVFDEITVTKDFAYLNLLKDNYERKNTF